MGETVEEARLSSDRDIARTAERNLHDLDDSARPGTQHQRARPPCIHNGGTLMGLFNRGSVRQEAGEGNPA